MFQNIINQLYVASRHKHFLRLCSIYHMLSHIDAKMSGKSSNSASMVTPDGKCIQVDIVSFSNRVMNDSKRLKRM